MLRVPLLRDVLTEDFVKYYEDNEGRLSASGALRRIAFEHDLDWGDALLKRVFDEPGRLMAWRGADGTLRYWALSMERNGLAKVLQTLGTIAPADTQLSRAGEVGGTPLYALRIGPARSLLLAGKGDRLVVLSEAGMLLDAEGKPIGARAKAVAAWLSEDAGARETRCNRSRSTPPRVRPRAIACWWARITSRLAIRHSSRASKRCVSILLAPILSPILSPIPSPIPRPAPMMPPGTARCWSMARACRASGTRPNSGRPCRPTRGVRHAAGGLAGRRQDAAEGQRRQ